MAGNAFAQKVMESGQPRGLQPLRQVQPDSLLDADAV